MRCIALFVGTLSLVACGSESLVHTIPKGPQTVTGILRPATLSVARRGTHLLVSEGQETLYVESTSVSLRRYEGKRVTLRGILEANTVPREYPVLVVEVVESVEETTEEHPIRMFNLLLRTPMEWERKTVGEEVRFFPQGASEPLVTLRSSPVEEFPEGGIPLVISGNRAERLIDEFSGAHFVFVDLGGGRILTISFTPRPEAGDPEVQRSEFLSLLNSIEFLEEKRPEVQTGTGSLGSPCGGTAGILCPPGFLCEVTDLKENIGRCRRIVM